MVQSLTATPTIGQFNRPRRSRRYSEWNVMTFARSPVIPNTTRTSASVCLNVLWASTWATWGRVRCAIVMVGTFLNARDQDRAGGPAVGAGARSAGADGGRSM